MEHKEDPLLVSTCGIDQILVQCFPVHSNATLKVKLQIITPLEVDEKGSAAFLMPAFMERNFQVETATEVDVEAAGKHLQGSFANEKIGKFAALFHVDRDKNCNKVYCVDRTSQPPRTLERNIAEVKITQPKSLLVLLDGSVSMKEFMPAIIDGLKYLPNSVPTKVLLVADESKVLCPAGTTPGSAAFASALTELQKFKPAGGQNDFSALSDFLLKRAKNDEGAVLWIHAAQPAVGGAQSIKQLLGAGAKASFVYDLQVAAGPNDILEGVDNYSGVARVAQNGDLCGSLRQFFKSWTSENIKQEDEYVYLDAPTKADSFGSDVAPDSMAKLAAYNRILLDLANPSKASAAEANELARDYHLVTPISSAVVVDPIPEMTAVIVKPVVKVDNAGEFLKDARRTADSTLISIDSFVTTSICGVAQVFSSCSPFGFSAGQEMTRASFSSIVNQLNSLNSVRKSSDSSYGGGGSGYGNQLGGAAVPPSSPGSIDFSQSNLKGVRQNEAAREYRAAKPYSKSNGPMNRPSATVPPTLASSSLAIGEKKAFRNSSANYQEGEYGQVGGNIATRLQDGKVKAYSAQKQIQEIDRSSSLSMVKTKSAEIVSSPTLRGVTNGTIGTQGIEATDVGVPGEPGEGVSDETFNKNDIAKRDVPSVPPPAVSSVSKAEDFDNSQSKDQSMLQDASTPAENVDSEAAVIQGVNTAGTIVPSPGFIYSQDPLDSVQRLFSYLLVLIAFVFALLQIRPLKAGLLLKGFLVTLTVLAAIPISNVLTAFLMQGIK
ncbi:MAG: hypothetical protein K2X81_02585, partial [Candidatus Obscuribacterales bacterium]|nr:hypothetical protein [Candidatus Obscuribacterales bacterium]